MFFTLLCTCNRYYVFIPVILPFPAAVASIIFFDCIRLQSIQRLYTTKSFLDDGQCFSSLDSNYCTYTVGCWNCSLQ